MASLPTRNQIKIGMQVSIETKEDQGTGKLTVGMASEILTASSSHPHGIKVKLADGQVGRVKNILKESDGVQTDVIHRTADTQRKTHQKQKENTPSKSNVENIFADLDGIEIPKTENKYNEFKEFYQYDEAIEKIPDNQEKPKSIKGIKQSVQERFAIAVCSFGNDPKGGFVYLGIKSDGTISGLDRDKKLEEFSDYDDAFANHIRNTLETLLKERVFIISNLFIKFRTIDGKTICIIQVLPANKPLYLHSKEKSFFVRGSAPRAEKLDVEEQFRFIKRRFPTYG